MLQIVSWSGKMMPRTTHLSHAIAEGREANRIEGAWRLEEAKSRFSEVVRRARSEGPQRVTVRGRDAVVVIAADEFDRLVPPERGLCLSWLSWKVSRATVSI